jgi:hypothetical protein
MSWWRLHTAGDEAIRLRSSVNLFDGAHLGVACSNRTDALIRWTSRQRRRVELRDHAYLSNAADTCSPELMAACQFAVNNYEAESIKSACLIGHDCALTVITEPENVQ